jgi:serine/threonine protein kinase
VSHWKLCGQPVAVKIFTTGPTENKMWRRELGSLTFLAHKNIVRVLYLIYENISDRAKARPPVGFAMELMACSALDKSEGMSLVQQLRLFEQVASALAHSHEHGIIHFDVKPENILVDDKVETAKLCDFGCAHKLYNAATSATTSVVGSVRGTTWYMAPEVIDGNIDDFERAKLCDIYSFGKTMWKLLHPKSKPSAIIGESRVSAPVPEALKELVEICTRQNPALRPQAISVVLDELREILRVLLLENNSSDQSQIDPQNGHAFPRQGVSVSQVITTEEVRALRICSFI